MALPYFDDIYKLTQGTDLQRQYDQAYAEAVKANSPSAPSLWTGSSMSTSKRMGFAFQADQAEIVSETVKVAEVTSLKIQASASEVSDSASALMAATVTDECRRSTLEVSAPGTEISRQESSGQMSSVSISSTPPSDKLRQQGGASTGRVAHSATRRDIATRYRASEGDFVAPTRSTSYTVTQGGKSTVVRIIFLFCIVCQ